MKFYLGTHEASWLGRLVDVPLFVSRTRLARYATLPVATTTWAMDSGGFTEVTQYGGWRAGPAAYIAEVRRYRDEVGGMEWAAPQDWMCEPAAIAATGLTVAEHQRRTVQNYLELRSMAPDLTFVPVLQGWQIDDYHRCVDMYAAAGVDLTTEPTVGVGSVCRRQGEGAISSIFDSLARRDLNLHGFGVKMQGLRISVPYLVSADSLAWSYSARMDARSGGGYPGCRHNTCANCIHYALRWRERVLADTPRNHQMSLLSLYQPVTA